MGSVRPGLGHVPDVGGRQSAEKSTPLKPDGLRTKEEEFPIRKGRCQGKGLLGSKTASPDSIPDSNRTQRVGIPSTRT